VRPDSLTVAVVAAEMEGQPTGVGRFLAGLLGGVCRLDLSWRWRLLFQGAPFDHELWEDPRFEPVFCGSTGSRVLWEQLRLPRLLRREPPDLLYSPSYSLPPSRTVPAVVSLHDLSFERLPEEYSFRERWRRRWLARRAAARADRVLVDSELVRDEVSERYRVGRDRLGVVPVAVDPRFSPVPADGEGDALEVLGVRAPYLLSVGTVLARRCTPLLLEVAGELMHSAPDLQLVLVGANRLREPRALHGWIEASGLGARVLHLGWVEDGVLAALYRRARLSLYLSLYEGFGIPPMESLACGTPVVVGPGLGLDDLWPDYPFRSASLRRAELIEVARRTMDDRELRDRTMDAARRVLAALSPERVAEAVVGELAGVVAA
jgi:glycosyltransferase involved in cell wall biosynthesis